MITQQDIDDVREVEESLEALQSDEDYKQSKRNEETHEPIANSYYWNRVFVHCS